MKPIKFTLVILILISLSSCSSKKSKKITITDFSHPIIDSLIADPDDSYSTYLIKVKGSVDDTVYVKMCEKCYEFYLTGQKIDTLFNTDFYGGTGVFIFDPYLAKKGELEVEYSIL